MKQNLVLLVFFLFHLSLASGQTDTSFFKDLPADEILIKAGMPTREEMRKTMYQTDSLMKNLNKGFKESMAEMVKDKPPVGEAEEDNNKPITLEEMIEHPAHAHFLMVNLKSNPLKKLPENFENLSELNFIIIANLPDGASFDFEDALNKISNISTVEYLYIINNRGGFGNIPTSIGQMTALKKLVCYNNSISEIPAEIGNLGNLEELSLGMNKISFIPSWLERLRTLRLFELQKNNIRPADYDKIHNLLPNCKVTFTPVNLK